MSVDPKELKEIEKSILKGINLSDQNSKIKTVAGFEIKYSNKTYHCCGVVLDLETKEEKEHKEVSGQEIMSYSPTFIAFREGPAIIEAYRLLEQKPDLLIVKGNGALHKNKVGLASYVGVILNKPCIGVSKNLMYGNVEEDKIFFENELKGVAVKTKEFSNPVYVTTGHNMSVESAGEIIKKLIKEPYKMPLPLHLAHKYLSEIKKNKLNL